MTVASKYLGDTVVPNYMRRQPDKAPATYRAWVRSPTTTSTPFARNAASRSSRRTNARTGRSRPRSMSTIVLPAPLTRPGTPVARTRLSEGSIVGAPSACLNSRADPKRCQMCKNFEPATHPPAPAPKPMSTREALFQRCSRRGSSVCCQRGFADNGSFPRAWHRINNTAELDRAEAWRGRIGPERPRLYSTIPILLADRSLR
jgi:hypothetical protein